MNKLVMIIDDSPTIRKIVEVSLKREGIAYISYTNGVDALHTLSSRQDLIPDLVFLDIGMPKIDGYRVAQYFKGKYQYKNTVVVMLSGYTGILDRLKGRLVGARNYITKPFRPQELVSVVHEYLDTPPLQCVR